jgi:CheY-like chemotaxis protein
VTRNDELTIVLVEDDSVDAEAVIRAFRKRRIANRIVWAADGLDGLAVLRGESPGRVVARPFVILLDLNMPRMNGIEFLCALRGDPALRDSIVFVLTTSRDERDVVAAYERNVAGYLVKESVGSDFEGVLGTVECYWKYVVLPPERCHAR